MPAAPTSTPPSLETPTQEASSQRGTLDYGIAAGIAGAGGVVGALIGTWLARRRRRG